MASRRQVVLALAAGALAPLATLAQQPAKVWHIGFLAAGSPNSAITRRLQRSVGAGPPTTATIDTTVAQVIDFYITPGAATHGFSLVQCTAEIIP